MSGRWAVPSWVWAVLLAAILTAVAALVLRLGLATVKDTFERDVMVLAAGAVIGGFGSLLARWLSRREEYRKGAYTERARAVQARASSMTRRCWCGSRATRPGSRNSHQGSTC